MGSYQLIFLWYLQERLHFLYKGWSTIRVLPVIFLFFNSIIYQRFLILFLTLDSFYLLDYHCKLQEIIIKIGIFWALLLVFEFCNKRIFVSRVEGVLVGGIKDVFVDYFRLLFVEGFAVFGIITHIKLQQIRQLQIPSNDPKDPPNTEI